MGLRGPERVGADDRRAWIVAVAVAPGGAARRILADGGREDRAPLQFEPLRTVAAEVARILPELAILVEILRGEDVDGQRLHAGGRGAVGRGHHDDAGRLSGLRLAAIARTAETHGAHERIARQIRKRTLGFRRIGLRAWAWNLRGGQHCRQRCAASDTPETRIRHHLRRGLARDGHEDNRECNHPAGARGRAAVHSCLPPFPKGEAAQAAASFALRRGNTRNALPSKMRVLSVADSADDSM